MTNIHLGFEVGSGAAIALPLGHMVVTGQTQLSGKTTTLEALVDRSGLKAIAFVTKRFEGAFSGGNRLDPYFRERTDWRFVASLIEATMQERMRKERPFILRVTKATKSLADVHRNVRAELKKTKSGYARDMYTMLDEYLKIAVEDLGQTTFAESVALEPGLNVMDLSELQLQTQSLVIASVMEWVYQRERDTVTIIPEAWEFLPLQRASPVTLAAEQLIRKGAAGGNYVWLDSQDLAGVAAAVRKQVSVYLIGVQREENEVKRMLAHIAGATKPSRDEIMSLDRGHFVACWRGHAHKVYVQPKWMNEITAKNVATGTLPMPAPPKAKPKPAAPLLNEEEDMPSAKQIAAELHKLMQPSPASTTSTPAPPTKKAIVERVDVNHQDAGADELADVVYERVVARLLAEHPTLLKVSAEASEIEVTVKRQVIQASGDTLRGRIAILFAEGFFEKAKSTGNVKVELVKRGFSCMDPHVAKELAEFARMGFLTKNAKWFSAVPGMKANIIEEE